ncbi:mitochondrial ribosomal protein L37-domain-containing protein [Choanephora cucurbitarum]|nr:mitochondrial ribosomal protein L37-domain-containing protein [Choanephora cucurbitarum]
MLSTIVRSSRPIYQPTLVRASYLHTTLLARNAADATTTTTRKPSAAPKGTVLKGLQYIKDKPEPVALDDSEYPEWLWDLLDEKKQKQKTTKPVNRQYHRKQNRDAIKAMNFMKDKKN